MITPESPISQQLQSLSEATGSVATPANAIDAAAFGLAMYTAPRLDTWSGIGGAMIAYGADLVDGKVARATGTSSELGAQVDAVGDKIKLGWAMVHILRLGLADTDLVAGIAAQNIANAAVTAYDRKRNDEPTLTAARSLGKKAMFGQAMSLGVQVIGTKVSESSPAVGNAIRKTGRYIGFGTLATFGVASTIDYIRTARRGVKKPSPRLQSHPLATVVGDGTGMITTARTVPAAHRTISGNATRTNRRV